MATSFIFREYEYSNIDINDFERLVISANRVKGCNFRFHPSHIRDAVESHVGAIISWDKQRMDI